MNETADDRLPKGPTMQRRASFRLKGKSKIGPDMNVTPLVDVVLVLLIIFMVLAPLTTSSFAVRIPPKPDEKDQQLAAVNDPDAALVLKVQDDGKVLVNKVELPVYTTCPETIFGVTFVG